ncbi:MAG: type II toxin-antitoxin system Phd/YefM family antitoxin [Sulfuricella sp.]|nr:type II toxin-antitoxin system Phd/YefM family antitoxin [Sulfuricella sp.]
MSEVSIADAKNHLPRIVQQAEAGETVHITRRGKPVAVLLSGQEYARLTEPRPGFVDFAKDWRKNMLAHGIEFPVDADFADLRDNLPGREVAWG